MDKEKDLEKPELTYRYLWLCYHHAQAVGYRFGILESQRSLFQVGELLKNLSAEWSDPFSE